MKLHRSSLATWALLLAVAVLGALFLATVGIDALEGNGSFQFYADSRTYHEVARQEIFEIDNWLDAVGVAGNFLGPLMVLQLTGENYYLVMLFNVALFGVSTFAIARTLKLDSLRYALVLLVNPVVLSSMLSVNKEVLGIAAVACILRAYENGSLAAWTVGALLSLLVRWQMTVFVIAMAAIVGRVNPIRSRRGLTLLTLLAALSLLYVALSSVFEPVRINFQEAAEEYQGSGFYEWLVAMQNAGYYWLVFPLKAAHLMFGAGLRPDRLLSPTDLYNDVIQPLHATALLVLFVLLLRRGRMRLDDDVIYASILYLAIFGISPIYSPRYLLPVYVLWAAAWAAKGKGARVFPIPRDPRKRLRRVAEVSRPSNTLDGNGVA